MRHVRQFFRNIYRVLVWIPVIWKDRWFDYSYLLRIIEFKLRYDAKRYETKAQCCHSERRAKEMRTAAELCNRLVEKDYFNNNIEWIQKGEEFFDGYFKAKEGFFGGDSPIEYEDYMQKQDLEYLCYILQKCLKGWWD